MVATDALPLTQLPPDEVVESVVEAPTHTTAVPVIAAGNAFTVTTTVLKHPVVVFSTDIVAVPALTPATTPEEEPTAATDVLLLVQYVPLVELSTVFTPTHVEVVPAIADGVTSTLTTAVLTHPVPRLYEIVAVPGVNPVTTPDVPIEATVAFDELHVPPEGETLNVIPDPTHMPLAPVMAPGPPDTVTVTVA